jgi:hypothetical protein
VPATIHDWRSPGVFGETWRKSKEIPKGNGGFHGVSIIEVFMGIFSGFPTLINWYIIYSLFDPV